MRLGSVRIAIAALAVALAAAACSGSNHPVGPSPSPFGPLPDVPVADSRPGVPPAAVKALATALQLKPHSVHVVGGLTNGDHALALVRFRVKGRQTRGLVSFEFRAPKKRPHGKQWSVEAASPDLWATPPTAGSRSYPVTSVAAGEWVGVGGFVDPHVHRLEAVGPTGSLVDQQPVKGGAVLVFAAPGSTLAGYDDNGLVFATPVVTGSPPSVGGGDAAVGLGSTFAAEIISPRWTKAADLVTDDVPAAYMLPPLHSFLASDRARVDGQGQKTKTGASFVIDSGPLKWRLNLITVPHGGTLKVRQYTLNRISP
jgi:hypothetical protein